MPTKYHRGSDRRRGVSTLVVAIWVIAALSACAANVSFKPGVQGDAIAKDERECRVASSDDRGYRACMEERGYTVFDDDDIRTGGDSR